VRGALGYLLGRVDGGRTTRRLCEVLLPEQQDAGDDEMSVMVVTY